VRLESAIRVLPRKEHVVPVDPKRTAVVLIEYQNDSRRRAAPLHEAVQGVMEKTGMLENTRRLVAAARTFTDELQGAAMASG
jgi:hypothetical protein